MTSSVQPNTTQANWLEDYALFRALKSQFEGAYYLEWPEELVQRRQDALVKAQRELATQIDQFRLEQFLLLRQAHQLKEHAHAKGGLDWRPAVFCFAGSSDVWANPGLFRWTSSVGRASSPGFLLTISARWDNCGAIPSTTGMHFVRLVIGGVSTGCVHFWLT